METCKRCNVNKFDPWAAKDKGQKYPFRSCFDCRMKAKARREQQEQAPPQNDKVQQLEEALFNLEKRMLAVEKSMGLADVPGSREVEGGEDTDISGSIDASQIPF